MLKKDNYLIGVALGTLVPAILYFVFVSVMEGNGAVITSSLHEKFQLVLVAVNAIMMRLLLVNKKFDKAGRAILLITLIGAIAHFAYFYTDLFQ